MADEIIGTLSAATVPQPLASWDAALAAVEAAPVAQPLLPLGNFLPVTVAAVRNVAASASRSAGPASTDRRTAVPVVPCVVSSAATIDQSTVRPITPGRVPVPAGAIPMGGAAEKELTNLMTGLMEHNLIDCKSAQALVRANQGMMDAFDVHVHYKPTMNYADGLFVANSAWGSIRSDAALGPILGEFLAANGINYRTPVGGGAVLTAATMAAGTDPAGAPLDYASMVVDSIDPTNGDFSNQVRTYLEGYLRANGVAIRPEGQADRLNMDIPTGGSPDLESFIGDRMAVSRGTANPVQAFRNLAREFGMTRHSAGATLAMTLGAVALTIPDAARCRALAWTQPVANKNALVEGLVREGWTIANATHQPADRGHPRAPRVAPAGSTPIASRDSFLALHAVSSIRVDLLVTMARSMLKARMVEYQAPLGDLEGESLVSTIATQRWTEELEGHLGEAFDVILNGWDQITSLHPQVFAQGGAIQPDLMTQYDPNHPLVEYLEEVTLGTSIASIGFWSPAGKGAALAGTPEVLAAVRCMSRFFWGANICAVEANAQYGWHMWGIRTICSTWAFWQSMGGTC